MRKLGPKQRELLEYIAESIEFVGSYYCSPYAPMIRMEKRGLILRDPVHVPTKWTITEAGRRALETP